MESEIIKSRIGRAFWVALGGGILASLLVVADFSWFTSRALHYTRMAREGRAVLPPGPSPEEAIVVLTGAHDRIPKAIELLKLRGSPLLIISGTGKGATLTDLANQQGDAIFNIHEVWQKIVLEPRSASTIENAEESGKILAEKGVRRVILVTSDYHMRRSLLAFENYVPQYEYFAFPVMSVLGELSVSPLQSAFESAWRLWIEYWKLFFFRLSLWFRIPPNPATKN